MNASAQCDSVYIRIKTHLEEGNMSKYIDHFSATGKLLFSVEYSKEVSTEGWGLPGRKYEYTYDVNDSLIQMSHFLRVENNLVETYRNQYTYNNTGYRISSVTSTINNGIPHVTTADSTFFDIQNRISEKYLFETSQLKKTAYHYNSSDEDTIRISELLDSLGNWNIISKNERHFDAGNNLIADYSFQFNSSVWDSSSAIFYFYNSDPLVDTMVSINYLNHYTDIMYIYEYGPLEIIIHTFKLRMNNGIWEYSEENITEVDSFGYPSYNADIAFYYIGGNLEGERQSYTYYSYDSLGNMLSYYGDNSPGGPHDGGITYLNGVPIHAYTYSETMGGFTTTSYTDYFYTDISGNTVLCTGSTTTLSLDSCSANGRSYLWSTGATTPSIVVGGGTYSATITYANGYTVSTEEIVVQESGILPVIASGTDSTITRCSNIYSYLFTTVQPGIFYQWYRNDTALVGNNSYYLFLQNDPVGYYYLIGTSACGSDTSSITSLNILPAPPPPVITSSTNRFVYCTGDSLTLTSSPALSYLWTPGNSTDSSITISTTGYYTVKVTGANGCTSSTSQPVQEYNIPSGITLETINNQIVPSTFGYYAIWLLNGDTISPTASLAFTPTVAGYYSAIIFNNPACYMITDSIYVDPTVITVHTYPDFYVCMNGAAELINTNHIIGGLPPYTTIWTSVSGNLIDFGNGESYMDSIVSDEICIFTVTDSQGLTGVDTVLISVDSLSIGLSGSLSFTCASVCNGQLIATPTGISPYNFNWSNGATTIIASGLCEGTYRITITDSIGCTASDSATVLTDSVGLDLTISSTTCIGCDNGTITADVANEIGSIQYFITPAIGTSIGNVFSLLPPGIYEICISDSNQCVVCKTDTIFEDPTGLNENIEIAFSVFPNPAREEILIHLNNLSYNKFYSVEDVQGRKLLIGNIEENVTRVDLTGLLPGLYYIRTNDSSQKFQRFIKE